MRKESTFYKSLIFDIVCVMDIHCQPAKKSVMGNPVELRSYVGKCNQNSNVTFASFRALHFEYSDKKKFVCDVCSKDFKDPSALSAHKKIHSTVRPFQCKECGRKFVTAAQLRVHMVWNLLFNCPHLWSLFLISFLWRLHPQFGL